ncbi:YceI family protein [bacterium]|nr:YceI family protein [bacterium]
MKMMLALLLLACSTLWAGPPYSVVSGDPATSVVFESDAPLEKVVGRTTIATGTIELPESGQQGRAEVHVDMASITTGLSLRDKHMRENHLHTDKFPEAVFTSTEFALTATPVAGSKVLAAVKGNFTLHGVTRELSPEVYVTLSDDNSLIVEAAFTVTLADYEIPRPEFLVMKLSELQQIKVKLKATPTP